MNHILIAHDGSAPADRAFEFALELARKFGAKLSALSVVRPPEPPDEVETEAVVESAKEHYEQAFERLRSRFSQSGVDVDFAVMVGHPAEQIVHYAESHGIDHIVMGHRGKTFFRRWLLGSVSKQVIHYAHCTTTIVR
jgi:nucleotide-binding universal stress UspA family protein